MGENKPRDFIEDSERLNLIIESLTSEFNALIDVGIDQDNARKIIEDRARYLLNNPEDDK